MCGRVFSKTNKKNLRFQKYPDTCGRGLRIFNPRDSVLHKFNYGVVSIRFQFLGEESK